MSPHDVPMLGLLAKRLLLIPLGLLLAVPACAQAPATRPSLDGCEGCEAIAERPAGHLGWQLTIPEEPALAQAGEPGEPLVLSGRALRADGRTPAPGVVVYVHHTNAQGVYPTAPGATGWARRHGRLRGWLVTGPDGQYEIHTIRPAPYPGRDSPAHIHLFVDDGEHPPYYLYDTTFEDDPLVTSAYRASLTDRIDPGVIALTRDASGTLRGHRDLILEY